MNKKFFFLFLVLAVVGAGILTYFNPNLFTSYIFTRANLPTDNTVDEKKLKHIYDVNMVMSKTPMGSINTYLPKFTLIDLETASYFQELFDLTGTVEETEDLFYCNGDRGKLNMYKYDNLIEFIANPDFKDQSDSSSQPVSELEAIEKAVKYVENNYLFLSYEESKVTFDGRVYEIQFINRIGNIKSYAFNTMVKLDQYGNLVSILYYNMNYERFNNCKIKSMETAYLYLPINFPEGTKVDLKKCELVYIYEDSIIQPAYLFEGEFPDGKYFQSFVKAAVYTY